MIQSSNPKPEQLSGRPVTRCFPPWWSLRCAGTCDGRPGPVDLGEQEVGEVFLKGEDETRENTHNMPMLNGRLNGILEPQTTICKWMFQLDDSKSLHKKWLFHQTSNGKEWNEWRWENHFPFQMIQTKQLLKTLKKRRHSCDCYEKRWNSNHLATKQPSENTSPQKKQRKNGNHIFRPSLIVFFPYKKTRFFPIQTSKMLRSHTSTVSPFVFKEVFKRVNIGTLDTVDGRNPKQPPGDV